MKILVCEDEPILRKQICRSLNQQGWQTKSCANCEELYEAMDGTTDLLLLDVHLPDGCVYPTVSMLQKSFSVPVIFFSSDTQEDLVLRGYDLDCVTFMPKPLKPRILTAALSAFARRNGLCEKKHRTCRLDLEPVRPETDFLLQRSIFSGQSRNHFSAQHGQDLSCPVSKFWQNHLKRNADQLYFHAKY